MFLIVLGHIHKLYTNYLLGENTIWSLHFESQLIWSLHFESSHFGLCYFLLAVNLIPIINTLTKNAYMTNSLHY